VISVDDLPIDHATGVFPIERSDPAYQYDRNSDHVVPHSLTWSLPLNPTAAKSPHYVATLEVLVHDRLLPRNADRRRTRSRRRANRRRTARWPSSSLADASSFPV
jgi:hypothetical protein